MLTRKQHQLLTYIDNHLNTDGVPPSYDEMKDALGLKSKSGIHRLITGLEERGFIRRLPHKARALEVLKKPQNMIDDPPAKGGFEPRIVDASFGVTDPAPASVSAPAAAAEEMVGLPFYGKIAAGTPIEALRDSSRTFEVPPGMLGRGDHYALEVEGDSMIEAGILDGDTVIIRETETAENGAIVVALVDDGEVTLKRLRRRGDSIALEPANKDYETRIFGPDQVKVQGVLKALYRHY